QARHEGAGLSRSVRLVQTTRRTILVLVAVSSINTGRARVTCFHRNDRSFRLVIEYSLGIPNASRVAHPQTVGNPFDSTRMRYALKNVESHIKLQRLTGFIFSAAKQLATGCPVKAFMH